MSLFPQTARKTTISQQLAETVSELVRPPQVAAQRGSCTFLQLFTIGTVKGKTEEGSDSDSDICWTSLQYYFTDVKKICEPAQGFSLLEGFCLQLLLIWGSILIAPDAV